MRDATENSYSIIENNTQAFRSIKSPGSSKEFKISSDLKSFMQRAEEEEGSSQNFQFGIPLTSVQRLNKE